MEVRAGADSGIRARGLICDWRGAGRAPSCEDGAIPFEEVRAGMEHRCGAMGEFGPESGGFGGVVRLRLRKDFRVWVRGGRRQLEVPVFVVGTDGLAGRKRIAKGGHGSGWDGWGGLWAGDRAGRKGCFGAGGCRAGLRGLNKV
jgi:hypothetical protein